MLYRSQDVELDSTLVDNSTTEDEKAEE